MPRELRSEMAARLEAEGKTHDEIARYMNLSNKGVLNLLSKHRLQLEDEAQDYLNDTTPGCDRCGLRGPHECLPDRAEAYLGRRGESLGVRHTVRRAAGE